MKSCLMSSKLDFALTLRCGAMRVQSHCFDKIIDYTHAKNTLYSCGQDITQWAICLQGKKVGENRGCSIVLSH